MSLAPLKLVFLTWIATKGSVLTLRMRRGVYCFRYFDLVAFWHRVNYLKGAVSFFDFLGDQFWGCKAFGFSGHVV